jgi:predicted S18 family serine protease
VPSTPAPTPTKTTTIGKGSPLLDRKIDEATSGQIISYSLARQLHSINEDNAATIVNYVLAIYENKKYAYQLNKVSVEERVGRS